MGGTDRDPVPADIREALTRAQVPQDFFGGRFSAATEVTSIEVPPRGRLVRFGSTGLSSSVVLDPTTGQVLEVMEHGQTLLPVNSTVIQFAETVRAVMDLFPYYGQDSSLEEREAAAERVSTAIGRIDPAALEDEDSFWRTFLDDLVTGDFATEDVVG